MVTPYNLCFVAMIQPRAGRINAEGAEGKQIPVDRIVERLKSFCGRAMRHSSTLS
jgi:hypothetical protein